MILNGVEKIATLLQKWINGMKSFPDSAEADELLENQFDNMMDVQQKWKSNSKTEE